MVSNSKMILNSFFRLHRIPSDFSTPKVRDSFVSKFVYETEDAEDDDDPDVGISGSTPGLPPGGGMMGNHIPSNIVGGEGGAGGNYGLWRRGVGSKIRRLLLRN